MAKKVINTDFALLKEHVTALFPETGSFDIVPPKDQRREIDFLTETIGSQRFFFVVDLRNFEMREMAGISRWLGYSEADFTLKKYWSLVHPGRQKSLMMVALQLYQTLCTGKFVLNFMVQRYSSLVALRHYKGYYVLAKKTASVFQYDAENRLTAYLNEFTIIGQYNGEPLLPVFFNKYGEEEIQRGGEVMQKVVGYFTGMKVFSVNELQVARKLAYNESITQVRLAADFDVKLATIDTYCKRFLAKSRAFFHQDFSTVLEAALFLKHEGLL